MRFFTNRFFLRITLTLSLLVGVLVILTKADLCEKGNACDTLVNTIEPLGLLLFIPILLLPLAVIFAFVDGSIFNAWKRFAVWGIPALLVLSYVVTRDTGSHNFFSMDFSLYFLAILYGLFFLISLAIIAITAFKNG